MKTIVFPPAIKKITFAMFRNCTGLETVSIPSTVRTIDTQAFEGCTSLRSLVLPTSVKNISSRAFANCTALKEVDLSNVEWLGWASFQGCSSITNITLPDTVTTVNESSFGYMDNLETITFGKSVDYVGAWMFRYSPKVHSAYFMGNMPNFDDAFFERGPADLTVYYPAGNTTWSAFSSKFPNVKLMTHGTKPHGNSNSSRSGGSSSSSGSVTTVKPTDAAPITGPVKANDAVKAVQKALNTAKQAGTGTATIRFKNAGELSFETLQAMTKASKGTPLKINADSTLNNGSVDVRLSLDPSLMTKTITLSASTVSNRARSTKSFFERWYSNKVQVISFAQQGDFGTAVKVAAKLSKELDAKSLYFYSYDKATNAYKAIPNPDYWVDSNGFVHFTTTTAGDIIITDKPIAKK